MKVLALTEGNARCFIMEHFCLAEYACGKSGREAVVSFVLLRSNLLASRPKAQKIKKDKKHFA